MSVYRILCVLEVSVCMCNCVREKCIADEDVGKMVLLLRIGDPHLAKVGSRYTDKINVTRETYVHT